ncbi:uncharacterized protein BT62DRAFT_921111 [Guyanagaster necrorhizus]|uniref:Uncharacterized protein n=1 Tax=Guyanagaster necrorhizus TaxID=856835 RepID=A0A9P7VRZ2_9AGAR|nr:uncharacterized protein BT62DRAFT_921111 [Guyanagaster necrorhizus MCA 3950]KAG7444869.1 hypothetical protein BT62DRAFT_921111 [Guyanagaster necrorhizus MCA 3950]
MAGANYMGGKINAAKVRSRDEAGRQQKRFFGRQRLNLLSKGLPQQSRRSITSRISRNQPQPTISLAHSKQNSTLSPQGYIPSPSKPPKFKRDGPSFASSSSKVPEALDTSEPIFLRAAMNQILSLPDLAGLSTYKKRKRTSDTSSSKRVKSERSPEKDEELSFGSQHERLCHSPLRDIYHNSDGNEYDDELDDPFIQPHHLGSHTTSSISSKLFPSSAPSQRKSHIPIPNDSTSSLETLPVTSSLQTSFSGNIFDYDDPWTAMGVILGLKSAPSTPVQDMDNTSALAEHPRPPALGHQRRRVRLIAYSPVSSSEGIPVASSHSSDNIPPPIVDHDDQSDDFHFSEDDNNHDFEDQYTHDIPSYLHQNFSPSLLHPESNPSSAHFASSDNYFNNSVRSPVVREERNDLQPSFNYDSFFDGSTSEHHSRLIVKDHANPEDPDDYSLYETTSSAIPDADQCIEEPIPVIYSSQSRSPIIEHPSLNFPNRQDTITTKKAPGVSPHYNMTRDILHTAQYVSSNAPACSSRNPKVDGSPRTSDHPPTNAPLYLLDNTPHDTACQLPPLLITIESLDSHHVLARDSQDSEPAVEYSLTLEQSHSFADELLLHLPTDDKPVFEPEGAFPLAFTGFNLFSKDDFLEESDSD